MLFIIYNILLNNLIPGKNICSNICCLYKDCIHRIYMFTWKTAVLIWLIDSSILSHPNNELPFLFFRPEHSPLLCFPTIMTCEVTVALAETSSASLFLLFLDLWQFCAESKERINPNLTGQSQRGFCQGCRDPPAVS